MVLAKEYETELDSFFTSVLESCARTVDGSALNQLLKQINVEREDPELSAWRRLEACLGFDADLAQDEVIEALVAMEDIAGDRSEECSEGKEWCRTGRCRWWPYQYKNKHTRTK